MGTVPSSFGAVTILPGRLPKNMGSHWLLKLIWRQKVLPRQNPVTVQFFGGGGCPHFILQAALIECETR